MKKNYSCKYCERETNNKSRICDYCYEKAALVRTIRAMLLPIYERKKATEKYYGKTN